MTARVAVVLATRNSSAFLDATLTSISEQTQPADVHVAVDDSSTDATASMLREAGFDVHQATSGNPDVTTRIAHNFRQGLRVAEMNSADVVVLGDHDDIWHRDRIAHQVGLLEEHPHIAMVASNGFLIDEHGAAVPGTIRDTFPIPSDFGRWSRRRRIGYALRHSLATGGASALRLAGLDSWDIPPGWLHDRWWSLRAVRADRLLLDDTPVIDYRVSDHQQVGLNLSSQNSPARWWLKKVGRTPSTGRKARDLAGLLRR